MIKAKISKFLNLSISMAVLLLAKSVLASNHLTDQPGINLTIQDVVRIITELTCWISQTALVLVVGAVVYYGIKFLMVQSDPTRLTDARKSFLWGLVGIAVILGTYTIIATVANALGADYTLFIPLNCTSIP